MKLLLKSTHCFSLLVLSTSVLAHGGHDHSHWTSPYLHVLLYLSIVAVSVGVTIAYVNFTSKSKPSKTEEKTDEAINV